MPCAAPQPRPPAQASVWFEADEVCGCDPRRCRACAICRSSGASPRSARPATSRPRRLPGSPPAPWASLLLGCEDGSTCPCPVPNVPQHRSCHEKGGSPRGNVIIRDETFMSRYSTAIWNCHADRPDAFHNAIALCWSKAIIFCSTSRRGISWQACST